MRYGFLGLEKRGLEAVLFAPAPPGMEGESPRM